MPFHRGQTGSGCATWVTTIFRNSSGESLLSLASYAAPKTFGSQVLQRRQVVGRTFRHLRQTPDTL
jgi:hypothetical protein